MMSALGCDTGPAAPSADAFSTSAGRVAGPDRLFALGSRATRLAEEYGALQRAILDFCDEMPKDVLARGDVARVMRRIQEASAYARALADKILDGPPASVSPFELESLDARGLVDAAHDGVRRLIGKKVCVHKQVARAQPPIHGHRETVELIFSSLLLLSAASMPTGGRVHLFVGPDAWANTRPEAIQDGTHVRVRLVDNGSPWASALRGQTGIVGEGMQQTVAALAEAIARCGAHLTCAKARDAGNTVELLLRAAD